MTSIQLDLFGGQIPWSPLGWIASDDRVRNGSSQSYFECTPSNETGRFYGNLDISALGGAGFASQRTTENRTWELNSYDGILLEVVRADSKRYTLTLKDEILPPNPQNGREQSTISYEYDFTVPKQEQQESGHGKTKINIPWKAFKATYRGKVKKDAPELDLKNIRRFSLLMRSFFGDQQGSFSLLIKSISAYRETDSVQDTKTTVKPSTLPYRDNSEELRGQSAINENKTALQHRSQGPFGWLFQLWTDWIRVW